MPPSPSPSSPSSPSSPPSLGHSQNSPFGVVSSKNRLNLEPNPPVNYALRWEKEWNICAIPGASENDKTFHYLVLSPSPSPESVFSPCPSPKREHFLNLLKEGCLWQAKIKETEEPPPPSPRPAKLGVSALPLPSSIPLLSSESDMSSAIALGFQQALRFSPSPNLNPEIPLLETQSIFPPAKRSLSSRSSLRMTQMAITDSPCPESPYKRVAISASSS